VTQNEAIRIAALMMDGKKDELQPWTDIHTTVRTKASHGPYGGRASSARAC
jgi:hypothetical protein